MSELINRMEEEICDVIALRNPFFTEEVRLSYAQFKSFDNVLTAIDCAIATNTSLYDITTLLLQIDKTLPSSICAVCGGGSSKVCVTCATKAIKRIIKSPQLKSPRRKIR